MARIGERDEVDVFVGARISLRRAALGLSQTALANRLGISSQQVQKYETGQNRISASRLHRTAMVLGTSVDSFFPPAATGPADDAMEDLRAIASSADGRAVAAGFPRIADRSVRKSVAILVRALSAAD